jgi:hypothetical protein
VALGFAILSKEVFALFVPAMVFAAWLHTSRYQRLFGLLSFVYVLVGLGSTFVLLAVFRGELLPYAWHLPWDQHPHLSMLDTLVAQARRGGNEGQIGEAWNQWKQADPVLLPVGVAVIAFNLLVGAWRRRHLLLALMAVSYWALLLRGGVVLPFYVIPLIPLMALNAALAFDALLAGIGRLVPSVRVSAALSTILAAGAAAAIVTVDLNGSDLALTQHPTSAQTQSMTWVRDHVPHSAVVVINSHLYLDLRQPGGAGVGDGATFPHAEVYWNVAYDPELHDGLLQGNWDRIDYIVADSEMLHDITTVGGPMRLIQSALQHSILRQEFRADDNDAQIVISIYQVIHKRSGSP